MNQMTEMSWAQHNAEREVEDRIVTTAKAAGVSGVRDAYRRFVQTQDEPGAAGRLDAEVTEALSYLGRQRDWEVETLRPVMLEMHDGRWRLRQIG